MKKELKKITIDWTKVKGLSPIARMRYFCDLMNEIADKPINKPYAITLEGKRYNIDINYLRIFQMCYQEYIKAKVEFEANIPSIVINWNILSTLSLAEQVEYLEKCSERILAVAVTDPVKVKTSIGKYEVNKRDKVILIKCHNELLKAKVRLEKERIEKLTKKSTVDMLINQMRTGSENIKRKLHSMNTGFKKKAVASLLCLGLVAPLTAMHSQSKVSEPETSSIDDNNLEQQDDGNIGLEHAEGRSIKYEAKPELTLEEKQEQERKLREEQERARKLQEQLELEAKERERRIIDGYFEEYCSYFNLDANKVIEIARGLTNDYETSLNDHIENEILHFEDIETSVMVFVYELQRLRKNSIFGEFGTSLEELRISDDIITLRVDEENEKYVSNGMTFNQYLSKISDMLGTDKIYLLSICYHETGRLKRELARYKNNFGGLGGVGNFYSYNTPEAGIIAYCITLKKYEKFNFQSLEKLSGKYVLGNETLVDQVWVDDVTSLHEEISDDLEKFFGSPSSELESDKVLTYKDTVN